MTLHQEVSRLRELLAKATPGPLSVETDATGRVYIHGGPSTETKGLGPKSRALIAGGCSEYTLTPENAAAFVEAVNALPALLDSLEMPAQGEVEPPYLSDRFEFAAPGDRQEDAWLLRFCDNDQRDCIWTGEDAEREAWAAWEKYAPAWNIYLFRLARLSRQPAGDEVERAFEAFMDAIEPMLLAHHAKEWPHSSAPKPWREMALEKPNEHAELKASIIAALRAALAAMPQPVDREAVREAIRPFVELHSVNRTDADRRRLRELYDRLRTEGEG